MSRGFTSSSWVSFVVTVGLLSALEHFLSGFWVSLNPAEAQGPHPVFTFLEFERLIRFILLFPCFGLALD